MARVSRKRNPSSQLEALGYSDLSAFLAANPCVDYVDLAKPLKGVSGHQIAALQVEEARKAGTIRDAARDCLSRYLAGRCRYGWDRGTHRVSNRASAFGVWMSTFSPGLKPNDLDAVMDATWQELVRLTPPADWVPRSASDPLLVQAFDAGWPPG